MHELIEKYKNFKIYDEKGRVYPLHITKAINQNYELKSQDEAEEGDDNQIVSSSAPKEKSQIE